jgi:hypothetical protein
MDAYLETLNRIYNLRGGIIDLRLERMERALALFDHPEKTFPSFHIARDATSNPLLRRLSHRSLYLSAFDFVYRTHAHR